MGVGFYCVFKGKQASPCNFALCLTAKEDVQVPGQKIIIMLAFGYLCLGIW